MPEELPAEQIGGAPEANQNTAQPETTDWEKRYTDTHREWNTLNEQVTGLRSDPNAVLRFLQEHHPDMLDAGEDVEDEPEFDDGDDEDRPLTRAEFETWKREQADSQRAQTAQQQFEADYKAVLNDREITKHGDRAIRYALNQGEIRNADDLKKAVDEWFEEADSRPAKGKPRVPHVPTTGQAATQVPNWDQMSRGEQNRYMAEQVMASQAQT